MSANKKRNIAKLETNYALQQEESQLSVARRKKFFLRRLTVFLILAAIISYLMVSTLISQNSVVANKTEQMKRLEQELNSLKHDEVLLKEEVVKLNDDDYIAKLARKEYFLSEDNEIIFTLPEKKKQEMEKSTN
ncbi:septum formation initiator family protein [Bacillus sp. V3B]|uniref:FtsB family cell division protein n=1 Tax=Bacillus sp. V3B TaxID=2804915 RepID=UPI00210A1A50|nr:septum formation initiator family protein [Bacillus sp. V3B]MCQ6276729.1 septum formation initiator family protein [Bacillus sp. V3B]